MENQTLPDEFYIVPFFIKDKNKSYILLYFFLIYAMALSWNGAIMLVVSLTTSLHTPLYLFLSNLSCLDMCYISVTVPKMMAILLSGNNTVTSVQCLTQLFFFVFMASTEVTLLTSMAYDRFLAICKPLHYQNIMNKEKCSLLLMVSWIAGMMNSFFLTLFVSTMSWCSSKEIHQFYCDIKALFKISCNNTGLRPAIYIDTIFIGLLPFLITLISYIQIVKVILQITNYKEDHKKAFSTCSSHLAVLLSFYGTTVCVYLNPSAQSHEEVEQFFSLIYTTVTPVLNPLIYTLRNKEVKAALAQLVRRNV